MPWNVELPDGSILEVPDHVTKEQVKSRIQERFPDAYGMSFMEHIKSDANAMAAGTLNTIIGLPKGLAETGIAVTNRLAGTDIDPSNDWLVQMTGKAQEGITNFFDQDKRVGPVESGIATGLGQVMALTGTALFGGGTSAANSLIQNIGRWTAPKAATVLTGISMQADEAFQDAVAHGASPDQRDTATIWGAAMGATEALPVFNLLDRFGGKGTGSRLMNMLKQGGIQALQEGVQELTQQGALNWYAGLSYDEQRKITEDLENSMAVGGGVGGIMGIIAGAFMPRGISRGMRVKALDNTFGEGKGKEILDRVEKMDKVKSHELGSAEEAAKQGWEFFPFGSEETSVFSSEQRAKFQAASLGTDVVKVGEKYFLGRKGGEKTEIDKYVSGEVTPGSQSTSTATPPSGSEPTTFNMEAMRQHLRNERDKAKAKVSDEEIDVGLKLVNLYSASLGMHPDDFVSTYLTDRPAKGGQTLTGNKKQLDSNFEQSDFDASKFDKYYHGTRSSFISDIKESGLRPQSIKSIIEGTLAKVSSGEAESKLLRELLSEEEYFNPPDEIKDVARPYDEAKLYLANDINEAQEYAEDTRGEVLSNIIWTLKQNEKTPQAVKEKLEALQADLDSGQPVVLEVFMPKGAKGVMQAYTDTPQHVRIHKGDSLYQDKEADVPIWSSRLFETIAKQMGQKPQPAGDVIGRVTGKWSSFFKQEEAEYIGLMDWLEMKKAENQPVSKEEVLDFIRQNGIQIEEVELSSFANEQAARSWNQEFQSVELMRNRYRDLLIGRIAAAPFTQLMTYGTNSDVYKQLSPEDKELADAFIAADTRVDELNTIWREGYAAGSTQWEDLTLPGGIKGSYKELLLKLPSARDKVWRKIEAKGYSRDGKGDIIRPDGENAAFKGLGPFKEDEALFADLNKPKEEDYVSGHWNEANVLAHVRFDERETIDGQRVIFINELQSDWHNEGARLGYSALRRVPNAPLKGNEWAKMVVKRMLRYAVDNGLDGIAWPSTAEQVAQVESWPGITQKNGRWIIEATGWEFAGGPAGGQNVTPIVNRYLVDLPKFMNQYVKQYGGQVVKTKTMSSAIDPNSQEDYKYKAEVNYLEINDQMREAYGQAQPLWQATKTGDQPRGQVTFLPDGKALIRLFESAKFSTIAHELAHVFRRTLPVAEQEVLAIEYGLKTLGSKNEQSDEAPKWQWTRAAEEKFARQFERYIWRGKAPVGPLDAIFEKFKSFMRKAYAVVKGSPIDVELTPAVQRVFDKMMTPGALNTNKGPGQMSFDLFKVVYGNEMADLNGVNGEVVGVPVPDRLSRAMRQLEANRLFLTPEEIQSQLPIVSDPNYISSAALSMLGDTDRISRLMHWASVNGQVAYQQGNIDELEKIFGYVKTAIKSYEAGSYDVHLLETMKQTAVLFQEMSSALNEARYFRTTPARQQLIDLEQRTGQKHVMHRDTGELWTITSIDGKNVTLSRVDGSTDMTIPRMTLATEYVTPDLIDPYSGDTLSRDEWLLEQHYSAVVQALESDQEVPIEAIRPHLNRDPSLQGLYELLVEEQKKQVLGEETLQQLREPTFGEKVQRAANEDPSMEFLDVETLVRQYATDVNQEEYIRTVGNALNEATYALSRLGNVFLHHGQMRFLDVIVKKNVHLLSGLRRPKRPLTTQEYLAHMLSELDAYQNVMAKDMDNLLSSQEHRLSILSRAMELHKGILSWYQEFENQGLGHMLEPEVQMSRVYQAYKAMRYKLIGALPKERTKAFWFFWDKMHTMQWKARRFPVMSQLFRLGSIIRPGRATSIRNMLLEGGEAQERTVEILKPKGAVEQRVIRNPGLHTFNSIKSDTPEYALLYKLLWGSDMWETRFTEEDIVTGQAKDPLGGLIDVGHLDSTQLTKVIKAYNEVRDTMDFSYFLIRDSIFANYGSKRAEAIMKKLYPKGFIDGYMPHIWEGDYAFFVKEASGKTIYMAAYETYKGRNKALEAKKKQLAGRPDLIIDIVDRNSGKEPAMFNVADLSAAIDAIVSEANITNITEDPEMARQIENALDSATVKIMQKHGIHSLFAKRVGTLGYDDRIHRVILSRVNQVAASLSKIEFAKNGVAELGKIHSSVAEMTKSAQEWYKLQLESSDSWDDAIAKIRALMFMRYLGANVKTALVVALDKITNVPAVLGQHTKGAEAKLLNGIQRTVRLKFWLKDNITPLIRQGLTFTEALDRVGVPDGYTYDAIMALHEQQVGGVTSARFAQELSAIDELLGIKELQRTKEIGGSIGLGPGVRDVSRLKVAKEAIHRAAAKAFQWSSKMIEIMETLNRESTFLTAYEVLRKEKGWDYDRAVKVAQDIMITSHFMYGKPNLPIWAVKKGITRSARPILTFRTFEMNYLQLLGDLMFGGRGRQARRGAGKSLFYMATLGGAMALPFISTLSSIYGWATGDDPEQEVMNLLNDLDPSEFFATLFSDGIPGLFGVTLRGSLQVGAYSDPAEVIAGAAGSYAKDVKRAMENVFLEHDYDEAFMRLFIPVALYDNPKRAIEAFQGKPYISRSGAPLRDAELNEITLTKPEAVMKGFGFQPQRVSEAYTLEGAMRTEAVYYQKERSNIYTKIKLAIRTENNQLLDEAMLEVARYNTNIAKVPGVSIIDKDSIRSTLNEAGLKRSEIIRRLRLSGHLKD